MQLRSVKEQSFSLTPSDIFILCTDGINTQLSLSAIDLNYTAQNMANTLFNEYHRVYGDVTILVAEYQPI